MILEDLRKREGGFDGETGIAKEGDVCTGRRDGRKEDVDGEEA
jgi:hypothetical protein